MLSNYISLNTNVNTNLLPWDMRDSQPTSPYILGQILAFSPAYVRVLNTMITFTKRFKLVYASLEGIAETAKVHPITAQRAIKLFTELGLMDKKYNGANKTCWYKTSTYFNSLDVMEALRKKIPLFYFTLRMLISEPIEHTNRSIIDLRSKEINIYKKTQTSPKKESMYPLKKPTAVKPQAGEQKYNKPFLPSSLNPFAHRSFDDNVQRWNEYENSQEVKTYISHFGNASILKQRNAFMDKLYNQHKGTFIAEVVEPEIKRQSITVDAELVVQPKTQEIKKDLPKLNVVDVKGDNSSQIKDFLKNINWDEDDEPTYDPSLEDEDLDSPLQL